MYRKIEKVLKKTPNLKARKIAKEIGCDISEVNRFFYKNEDKFKKNENHEWSLIGCSALKIELSEGWVSGNSFEQSLKSVESPLESDLSAVIFIIPKKCKIFLEAAARLIALCNQLVFKGSSVTIDFTNMGQAFSYLQRIGFFECLDPKVEILPNRPSVSIYRGENDSLVEFGKIDLVSPDKNIPELLKRSFVEHAGEEYSSNAFTFISELFGNVREHSETPIPGYAALQCYKGYRKGKPPRIQTVISDSGKGIAGTLMPILERKYPDIFLEFDFSKPVSEVLLVKRALENGYISRKDKDGQGLGFKRTSDLAAKYDASISVRQEKFDLILTYKNGALHDFSYNLDLPRIIGTHICFDLFLSV